MINPQTIAILKASIDKLRVELGNDDADETFRSDMLEGATTIDEVLSRLVRARIRARSNGVGAAHAKKEAAAHYDYRMGIAEREEDAATGLIREVLESAGLTKFKVPEGSISLSQGRMSLVLADDFTPPQGYQKPIKIEPDRTAIKAALEAGETIPGASLLRGEPIVTVR